MTLSITQSDTLKISRIRNQKEIVRARNYPPFSIVEPHISRGTLYSIDDEGYFIVAPEDCLFPNFVIELFPPRLANFDEYKELSYELVEKSSGFLWFDTDDFRAFDFVWRLRLPLRPSAPLFIWNDNFDVEPFKKSNLSYRTASIEELDVADSILSSVPIWHGGQTKEATKENINGEGVILIEVDSQIVGSASLIPLPENCVAIDPLVILQEHQNLGIEEAFLAEIGTNLASKNISLVGSMRNDNEVAFKIANRLGMKLAKQSYVAQIGSF